MDPTLAHVLGSAIVATGLIVAALISRHPKLEQTPFRVHRLLGTATERAANPGRWL